MAARAWFGSLSSNIVNLLVGIGSGVVVARLLGPTGRGELAAALFWGSFVPGLAILSLPAAVAMVLAREPEREETVASGVLLALALAGITGAAFALAAPLFVPRPSLPQTIAFVLAMLPVNFLGLTLLAADQGRQRFAAYNLLRLVPQATYLLAAVALIVLHRASVAALLLATWLGSAAVVAVYLPRLMRRTSWAWRPALVRELFVSGVSFHVATLVGLLFNSVDRLILTLQHDHTALGLYAIAATIAGAGIGAISGATNAILLPKMSAEPELGVRHRYFGIALAGNFWATAALNLTLAAISPIIIPLLFGDRFAPATPIAILLCLAQIPSSYTQIALTGLRVLGDWRAAPTSQVIAIVVFFAILAVGGREVSPIMVAAALLGGQLAAMAWMLRSVMRHAGLSIVDCFIPPADVVRGAVQRLLHFTSKMRPPSSDSSS